MRAHLTWTQAGIHRLKRQFPEAIQGLLTAADTFEQVAEPVQSLLALLELALLYQSLRRSDSLRNLTDRILPLMSSIGRGPMVERALLSFLRAAMSGDSTSAHIKEAIRALRKVGHEPVRPRSRSARRSKVD